MPSMSYSCVGDSAFMHYMYKVYMYMYTWSCKRSSSQEDTVLYCSTNQIILKIQFFYLLQKRLQGYPILIYWLSMIGTKIGMIHIEKLVMNVTPRSIE